MPTKTCLRTLPNVPYEDKKGAQSGTWLEITDAERIHSCFQISDALLSYFAIAEKKYTLIFFLIAWGC